MQYLAPSPDETLQRLISMTKQTNLTCLDKTLACLKTHKASYAMAAERLSNIAYRLHRAVKEVGNTLPPSQRASSK